MAARSGKDQGTNSVVQAEGTPSAGIIETWRKDGGTATVLLTRDDNGLLWVRCSATGAKGTYDLISRELYGMFLEVLGVERLDEANAQEVIGVLNDHFAARGFVSRTDKQDMDRERDRELGLL